MIGHHFKKFDPNEGGKSRFEQLLDMFMQLLTYTNGDLSEALSWMNELDKKFELTNDEYGIGDFIEELKDKVQIDLTDSGKGIPLAMQQKVFKPGYTTKKRGWGLGLSLSKRIIEQYHKGEIFVKSSEPGKGTTFRIVLKK